MGLLVPSLGMEQPTGLIRSHSPCPARAEGLLKSGVQVNMRKSIQNAVGFLAFLHEKVHESKGA